MTAPTKVSTTITIAAADDDDASEDADEDHDESIRLVVYPTRYPPYTSRREIAHPEQGYATATSFYLDVYVDEVED